MNEFEFYLTRCFKIGEFLRNIFAVYVTKVTRKEDGAIIIDQTEKMSAVKCYPLEDRRAVMLHEKASYSERTAFLIIVGSLIFIGSVSCPHVMETASRAARHSNELIVGDMVRLNKNVTQLKSSTPVSSFGKPCHESKPSLVAFLTPVMPIKVRFTLKLGSWYSLHSTRASTHLCTSSLMHFEKEKESPDLHWLQILPLQLRHTTQPTFSP